MTENDDQIITDLQQWKAKRQQPDAPRKHERWPLPQPFGKWIMATQPGPKEPCPECRTWGLRLATPPDNPAGEARVICTMIRCEASPFYRD